MESSHYFVCLKDNAQRIIREIILVNHVLHTCFCHHNTKTCTNIKETNRERLQNTCFKQGPVQQNIAP